MIRSGCLTFPVGSLENAGNEMPVALQMCQISVS